MAIQLPAAAAAAGRAGAAAASATAGSSLAAALGPIGLGISILSAGISYFSARKAKKKAKKAARAAMGELLNFDGTNNFIPVIYGTRRIEGTLVYISTNDAPGGDPNEFLYLVYALCEGQVDEILEADILVDGLPVSDARFNYTDSINTAIYTGTDAQTADAMLIAETSDWTADHKLSGIAYIRVRLKWTRTAFANIPVISALVKGKKVYDPRTTTTVYSTNPALCIRDYLTNERYGKGLDAALIDDASIIAAANFYDTTVTYWTGGGTGKIFEFNAIVDTEQSILDNLKDMMLCCRGFMPFTGGIYSLIPDKSASSVFAFTIDNIIGGITIRGENKADKYNRMICTFIDPTNNWQENTAIWPEAGSAESLAYLVEDNDAELVGEIELPFVTNFYAARDLARVFLLRSRNAIRTSFNANSDALNVTVGDVVTVTHPTPGWAAKPFQVEEVAINYDGTCTVSLLEYDSSIYSYDPASEQLAYADTNLPNPFLVAYAPTSFVITETTYLEEDGTVVPEIEVSWTQSTDSFVDQYEFQWKASADSVYQSIITTVPRVTEKYVTVGLTFDIRVRGINATGAVSAWLSTTYTVLGDLSAPATPTGLTITGDYNQAVLKWNAATEKDYKETLIYASTTNNSATATLEARISGNTVTVAGLPVSTTYYVWLKNEDFSGNVSGFSTGVAFSTTAGAAAISVVAGGTIAGTVTTDSVQISTIRTNAASGKSISDTLLVSGTATLKGVIQPDTTGAIRTGTITWNATTGALTGGTGIAITQWGIIGAASGVATFSIEGATGTAKFAGDVLTGGYMYAQGGYNDGTYTGAIYAQPSSSSQRGIIGRSTGTGVGTTGRSNTGIGVQGIADSTSGIAMQAVGGGASGVALNVIDGYITRAFSTTGRLTVYDQSSPYAAVGTYLYEFHV